MQERVIDLLFEVGQSLIVAGLIALLAKKYLSNLLLAIKLRNHGFHRIKSTSLSNNEIKEIFLKAKEIKILYVSGVNFLKKFHFHIVNSTLRDHPPIIKYLISKQNTSFLSEITTMEIMAGTRTETEDINNEIKTALEILANYNTKNTISCKSFNSQYRLPVIIAEFDQKGYIETKVWLTLTLPPYKSKNSIILYGCRKTNNNNDYDEPDFIEMIESYFDAIWETSDEEF